MNGPANTHPATQTPRHARTVSLTRAADHWVGRFVAMACPCEALIEPVPEPDACRMLDGIAACAWRIEDKFSRYRDDNIVHRINSGGGRTIAVDEETANLLDYAHSLYQLSEHLFDITSGALRRVWTFDGGSQVPAQSDIERVLPLVGWSKVQWQRPYLTLQPGMQIDLGGIGKEYAVDKAAESAAQLAPGCSCLVNFGGDLAVVTPRGNGEPWRVGVESTEAGGAAVRLIALNRGGLATSGDSRRFVLKDGVRYSHVLDPRTGWPVRNAPRSVTVAAGSCTQAGALATLALLSGDRADEFLRQQNVQYWLQT